MENRIIEAIRFCSFLLLCIMLLLSMALPDTKIYAAEGTDIRTEMEIGGSYSVEDAYTVIIPSDLSFTSEAATANISVGAGTNISVGRQLSVRLKETDSVKGGQLILERYDASGTKQTGDDADTVTVALSKKAPSDTEFAAVKGTEVIAAYSDLAASNTLIGTLRLTPQTELKNTKAGTYKGTVVFTVSLEATE